jgi:pyruvate dehydrogenase E1 component beta subunit
MRATRVITYAEALREAMCEEMRRDDSVFLMGEDIGVYGGAFGVTSGMIDEFGAERVRETPISETAFVGAGVGAALMGMRPIVELMFSDFISVCVEQVINQAAKMRFMFGGAVSVPMVLRAAAGGGTGAAAQHSQSLESLYTNIPGLKVVAPSTAYDAKGLLKSAIRDDDTVIFLEQKMLYRVEGKVPKEDYVVPLGRADIKREGRDISLISYGRTVQMCLAVANSLASDGFEVEVIDIRSLVPLDTDTIVESVKKTRRAVIVHEAVEFSGFGAEIAARIADSEAFFRLDAPIKRVGAYHCPIPFNPILEESVFPTPDRIESAIMDTLREGARHRRSQQRRG